MKTIEEYINSDLHTEDGEYTDKTIRDAVRFGYNLCNAEWQDKTRWIPVEERLPDAGLYVDVIISGNRERDYKEKAFINCYNQFIVNSMNNYESKFITHWREIIE